MLIIIINMDPALPIIMSVTITMRALIALSVTFPPPPPWPAECVIQGGVCLGLPPFRLVQELGELIHPSRCATGGYWRGLPTCPIPVRLCVIHIIPQDWTVGHRCWQQATGCERESSNMYEFLHPFSTISQINVLFTLRVQGNRAISRSPRTVAGTGPLRPRPGDSAAGFQLHRYNWEKHLGIRVFSL